MVCTNIFYVADHVYSSGHSMSCINNERMGQTKDVAIWVAIILYQRL